MGEGRPQLGLGFSPLGGRERRRWRWRWGFSNQSLAFGIYAIVLTLNTEFTGTFPFSQLRPGTLYPGGDQNIHQAV